MEIIKLKPAYKDYLWGGNLLNEKYNKTCDFSKVAESWELSTHPDGSSVVCTGEYAGNTFPAYLAAKGKEILGKNGNVCSDFPLLIKLIDAKESLSIQVHPDDIYAQKHEGQMGKTEMWYILACEPEAYLYYGVNRQVSKEEFQRKIQDNTVLEILNKVTVKKGDVFFIEAGTIHAIGAGIVICEIQQNSNCTYRVYDFDRKDANGNGRELHVEKALDVSCLSKTEMDRKTHVFDEISGGRKKLLANCKYFICREYEVETEITIALTEESFFALNMIEGVGKVRLNQQEVFVQKGECIFIPAQCGVLSIVGICGFISTEI